MTIKQMTGVLISCLLLLTSCSERATMTEHSAEDKVTKQEVKKFDDQLRQFAATSSTELLQEKGNQLYGPLGPFLLLSLLAEGAVGETETEISELLSTNKQERNLLNAYNQQLIRTYHDEKTVKLANSIWLDQEFNLEREFMKTANERYQAKLTKVPFAKNPKKAGKKIGSWVDQQLGANIYNPQTIDESTKLVLLNTLRLNLEWQDKFDPELTNEEVFHTDNKEVYTDFMHQTFDQQPYYLGPNFMASSLPLKDKNRLLLILPEKETGVRELLKESAAIKELFTMEENKTGKMTLSLPKFSFQNELDLKECFEKLGATAMFETTSADFSKVSSTMDLVVSNFVQKNQLELDEDKVEVKSYTEAGVNATAAFQEPEEIIQFNLNRPFGFMILNDQELPLFIGIFDEP